MYVCSGAFLHMQVSFLFLERQRVPYSPSRKAGGVPYSHLMSVLHQHNSIGLDGVTPICPNVNETSFGTQVFCAWDPPLMDLLSLTTFWRWASCAVMGDAADKSCFEVH